MIKNLWQQTELSDDQLIAELAQLNQQVVGGDNIQLAGHWLPYRYHAKSRNIYWCLPAGHATEPFQDETIARYRQTVLVNQFIAPKTALSSLDIQAQSVQPIMPAGFIFHLSRCGSTLISGCVSELDTTCVFSESPVLTEILLDKTLTESAGRSYLQQLVNLQASVFPSRPNVIVKWNAWDIFRWGTIRALYPQVPSVFLVRDPVEILASHQRLAGRHMSGDKALAHFHSVFFHWDDGDELFGKRANVLHGLLCAMHNIFPERHAYLVDYRQLSFQTIATLLYFMGLDLDESSSVKIQMRMKFNSKNPAQLFLHDKEKQLNLLASHEQMPHHILTAYNNLLMMTNNSKEMVINVG